MRWVRNLLKPTRRRKARLAVEELESRVTPYALSGNVWPHPQLITLSFVPDGTVVGSNGSSYLTSNLIGSLNAKFGSAAKWQNEILRAAQTWAAQTNINFAIVGDDSSSIGSGPDQQGDPNKGDIRISGYNFGNGNLAQAEMPNSDNNYSVSGDMQFNTGQALNIGSTYDLYTVALHEFGHALGLDHSSSTTAVMYSTYVAAKSGLTSDDVAGIRAIYSNGNARSPGAYAGNNSFATASNLTSLINANTLTALVNNLNITTTSEQDYYTFTAPANTSGALTVKVQSKGLSLLAPKAWVYAADQSTILGYASGANQYGTTLTITVNNVTAGQQLYLKVTGADGSAFSTGAYAVTLNFGTGSSPTVPLPNTTTANGSPLSGGGGLANSSALPAPWLFAILFDLVALDTLEAPAAPAGATATAAAQGPDTAGGQEAGGLAAPATAGAAAAPVVAAAPPAADHLPPLGAELFLPGRFAVPPTPAPVPLPAAAAAARETPAGVRGPGRFSEPVGAEARTGDGPRVMPPAPAGGGDADSGSVLSGGTAAGVDAAGALRARDVPFAPPAQLPEGDAGPAAAPARPEEAAPNAPAVEDVPESVGPVLDPAAAAASLAVLFVWSAEPEGLRRTRPRPDGPSGADPLPGER